jgi:hypothetical protein
MPRRLSAAREALMDIFSSPDPRKYMRRATFTNGGLVEDLEKSKHKFQYDRGAQGPIPVLVSIIHRHTMPPDFPRTINFMTANPGQQQLFTGCFNPSKVTQDSDDAWLDPKFFSFNGGGGAK